LGKDQTIFKSQIDATTGILERMREAINPEFIGIVSTMGLPVTVLASSEADVYAFASLAASSFAASSQLAHITSDSGYSSMFFEGMNLNIHISRVARDFLLVICFRNTTDIGKVRIITRRAFKTLSAVLEDAEKDELGKENEVQVEETKKAIDAMFINGSASNGAD
jgi:predicted regulator of Ras-like GTPase activity (Roadblock/LC7/MglB family)